MKSLSMYHPSTIKKVLNDFNRYYDSFFGDLIRSPEERILYYSPAVDIQENGNSYIMEAAFKDGILNLIIKKRAESQRRMIQTNAA
jgi:HSP20 family molecular chaperone IbpA